MFLAILALISNTSPTGISAIEEQMFLMNCPLPVYSVGVNITSIDGFNVIYDLDYNTTAYANYVTVFQCYIDGGNFSVREVVYIPTEGFFSLFDNAFAWVGYVYSTIVALFQKIYAFFTMISYFVLPANFNIFGYTLADLTGLALAFVIVIYAMCYLFIGAMIYKIVSPFSGVG